MSVTLVLRLSALALWLSHGACTTPQQQTQLAALHERMNQMLSSLYSSPLLSQIEAAATSEEAPAPASQESAYSYPAAPPPQIVFVSAPSPSSLAAGDQPADYGYPSTTRPVPRAAWPSAYTEYNYQLAPPSYSPAPRPPYLEYARLAYPHVPQPGALPPASPFPSPVPYPPPYPSPIQYPSSGQYPAPVCHPAAHYHPQVPHPPSPYPGYPSYPALPPTPYNSLTLQQYTTSLPTPGPCPPPLTPVTYLPAPPPPYFPASPPPYFPSMPAPYPAPYPPSIPVPYSPTLPYSQPVYPPPPAYPNYPKPLDVLPQPQYEYSG